MGFWGQFGAFCGHFITFVLISVDFWGQFGAFEVISVGFGAILVLWGHLVPFGVISVAFRAILVLLCRFQCILGPFGWFWGHFVPFVLISGRLWGHFGALGPF